MKKRVISLLIVATMLLMSMSVVFADVASTITIGGNEFDATSANVGDTITVPVTIDKFPGDKVIAVQVDVNFDNTALKFVKHTAVMYTAFNGTMLLAPATWTVTSADNANKNGNISLSFFDSSKSMYFCSLSTADADKGSLVLFNLEFEVLKNDANTEIKPTTLIISDYSSGSEVAYEYSKGTIGGATCQVKFTSDAPVLDKDVTLASVTVNGSAKTAAPYEFDVDNTVASTDITIAPTSAKATVASKESLTTADNKTFTTPTLSVGENKFTFTVTAEDTSVKQDYDVIINRAAAPKSNNANLKDLTISAGTLTPTFAADKTDYTATVENTVDKITVTATAADAEATVAGAGEKTLAVGENTIDVVVTAEDGTTKTYTIKVTRVDAPVIVPGAKVAGSVDKTEVEAAGEVTVTVNFTDLDTASALQYDLTYDKDAFTYVSSSLAEGAINTTEAGTIKVALAQGSAFTGNAVEGMTFTFDAKAIDVDKEAEFAIANAAYGSKDADAKLWTKVDAANYTQPGKVTVKATTDPLAKAKADAIAEIEAKVTELEAANEYFKDNNLDKAKADAIAAIEAATDADAVTTAKDAGITALEAVETKAELIDAKKKAVDTAASVKDNYFEEEMQLVYSTVVAKQAEADKAATKAELDVITAPDFAGIMTKAEVRADAKAAIDTAKGKYVADDYYADEFAEIAKIAADATTAVDDNTITKSADVKAIADKAATDMAAVKTKAVVALEKINAKGEYTVELFEDAGITDAKAENLNKYKLGVTNAKKTLTKEEVQDIVNRMNAVADPAVKGDLNGNGETDAGDAAIILKFVVGTLTGVTVDDSFLVTADVSGDGVITSGDASQVLNIVLNK